MTAMEGAFKNSNNIFAFGVYRARAKEKLGNLTCCKEGLASFKCAPKNEEESVRLAASIDVLPDPLAILRVSICPDRLPGWRSGGHFVVTGRKFQKSAKLLGV